MAIAIRRPWLGLLMSGALAFGGCGDDGGGGEESEAGTNATVAESGTMSGSTASTTGGSGTASGSGGTAGVECPDSCIEICEGGLCNCDCGATVEDCADCPEGTVCITTIVGSGVPGGQPQITHRCATVPTSCEAELTCDCATLCWPYETCSVCEGGICCESAAP